MVDDPLINLNLRCDNSPPSLNFISFCKEYNFAGFSFPKIETQVDSKGELRKVPCGVPCWKRITKKNYPRFIKADHMAFGVVTGSISGITVIDCDTHCSYESLVRDYPQLANTLTVRTAKGYHIYCNYEAGIKTNSNSFVDYPNVDVRNDGGVIFSPPTRYMMAGNLVAYTICCIEKPSASCHFVDFPVGLTDNTSKKQLEGATINVLTIEATADELSADDVNSDSEPPYQIIKTIVPFIEDTIVIEQQQQRHGHKDQYKSLLHGHDQQQLHGGERERQIWELCELLDALPPVYFDDYTNWFKVGSIIEFELGDCASSKDMFLKYSKKGPSYVDIVTMCDIERVWKSYTKPGSGAKATKASLYRACKLANPAQFTAIQKKYQSFDFSLLTTTQFAQYFLKHYSEAFIQTLDGVLYYWNAEESIWKTGLVATNYMLQLIGNNLFHDLQIHLRKSFDGITDSKEYKQKLSGIKQVQNRRFKENVLKDVLTELDMLEIEFDTNREQIDNIHFQNGVLMLNKVTLDNNKVPCTTLAFRPRLKSDYVTQLLPYSFQAAKAEHLEFVRKIFEEIQPLKEERDFQLSWNAYCITGRTSEQKFKLNVGYTAANGKSTEAKIHQSTFPIYTMKLHKTTFNENNQKQHKQFIRLVLNPIRYSYIEELDRTKLDAEVLKDYVDGDKLNVEIMFGTSITKSIQAKFTGNSNHDTNLKACQGILRRALLQNYLSQFKENPEKPNEFKLVKGRENLFEEDDDYKIAYLWLLLPYVVQFYEKGLIVPDNAKTQFEDIAEEYDEFKNSLSYLCDDGLSTDKISKDDLVHCLQERLGRTMTFNSILPELKRLGYIYERQIRMESVFGKKTTGRGAIFGLKWNPDVYKKLLIVNEQTVL